MTYQNHAVGQCCGNRALSQVIYTAVFMFLAHSSTPPPVWHDRTPNSLNSPHPSQPSPPRSLSSPKAHSSPRGALTFLGGRQADSTDFSLLLGNGSLEHSLLEAMDGLGSLDLNGDGGLPPLLPEKRRACEVGELASRSPSLSGFSSPHSGSSLSIPFSLSMSPDPLRGHGGASSPGPGMLDSLKVASLCDKTIVAKYAYKNHRNNVIIIQRFSKNLRTD